MKKIFLFLPFLLIGCAKVGDYQAKCEQQYPKMSDMAQCLDRSIQGDSRLSSSSTPKLYVMAAKLLSQGVDDGKISDSHARFELQNLYVNLQRQDAADQQAQGQAIQQALLGYQAMSTMQAIEQNARNPVYISPSPSHVDTSTHCNSGFGNTITCNSSSNVR